MSSVECCLECFVLIVSVHLLCKKLTSRIAARVQAAAARQRQVGVRQIPVATHQMRCANWRARTDAARRALASTRYEKLKQKLEEKQPETKTRAEILQEHLFSKEFYAQDRGGNMRSETRLRGIFSYFRAFVNAVHSLFVSPAKHILGICIVDDTNIQMAEPGGATAVYSAMNAIQTVSLRSGTDRHLHFRVHQPMVCLANATAATLHRHATAWFFCGAGGLGSCLKAIGLVPSKVAARFRCGIWVTDSLKANSSLFCQERAALRDQQCNKDHATAEVPGEVRLGLHVTCAVHKLSLVRKPLVLSVPHYWATLVRLAHLLQGRAFRQKFRHALACVVVDSFRKIDVQELPTQVGQWQSSADVIFSRCDPSRRTYARQAQELYRKIVNSDPSKDEIIHWCVAGVGPCSCESSDSDDCLVKVLRAFLGFLGRGFAVPLLQRWKHYGVANSYMAHGILLHNVLPRVLQIMTSSSSKSKRLAESVLAKAEKLDDGDDASDDGLNDAWACPDMEQSFAEMNGSRLRKVCAAMGQDNFLDNASLVNLLCGPFDIAMNKLLKRSRVLHMLRTEIDPGGRHVRLVGLISLS